MAMSWPRGMKEQGFIISDGVSDVAVLLSSAIALQPAVMRGGARGQRDNEL